MSFLGSKRIREEAYQIFAPDYTKYDKDAVQHCSYDLRLGAETYIAGQRAPKTLRDSDPYISIQPGQFAILTAYEDLSLPRNIMGFITLKNTFKMQGLINVSGFHVDPTFKEKLVFAVQNIGLTDIQLKYKRPTFTIFFANVEENDHIPREKKEGVRTGITLSDVQTLGGRTVTLSKLKKEIDQLRMMLLVYAPFAVAATAALIIALIKK
jgi:dCTP deaminase